MSVVDARPAVCAGTPPAERLRLWPLSAAQPRDLRHHRPRHLPPGGPQLDAPGELLAAASAAWVPQAAECSTKRGTLSAIFGNGK